MTEAREGRWLHLLGKWRDLNEKLLLQLSNEYQEPSQELLGAVTSKKAELSFRCE